MGRMTDMIGDVVDVMVAGMPALIEGPPGSGKTEASAHAIRVELANRLGCKPEEVYYNPIYFAYMDPVDMKGLPDILRDEHGNGRTVWLTPDMFPTTLPEGYKAVLVNLEEIGNSNRALHFCLYEILASNTINGVPINDNVYIVGTSNRKIDGCGVTKFPAAMRDRFANFEWLVDIEDWKVWAANNGIHYKWIAMMNYLSHFITEFDAKLAEESKTSSARSVTKAARCYEKNNYDKLMSSGLPKDEAKVMRVLTSYIGEVDAAQAVGFLKLFEELVPISSIIEDPAGADIPIGMDVLYALTAALARKANEDNIKEILEYIDRDEFPGTFASIFGVDLPRINKNGAESTSEFRDWVIKNG